MARYIDADALKERLKIISVVADNLYGMGINRGLDRADTEIDMLPTADVVEVKRGEWVKNGKTRTCSCCAYFYINVDTEDDNYCPNCGAKMDGGAK